MPTSGSPQRHSLLLVFQYVAGTTPIPYSQFQTVLKEGRSRKSASARTGQE
jgi:hypothetical protein